MIGIYYIKNLINEKYYIGQSINIERRFSKHIYHLKKGNHINKHLQASWDKYGKNNFEFKIIKCCKEKYLNRFEKLYIKKYNSYYNGYNQTIGGEISPMKDPLIAKKKGDSMRGENNLNYGKDFNKEKNPFFGKKHTQKSKEKMRAAKLGKKLSTNHKKNISKGLKGNKHSLKRQINESKCQNTTGYFRVTKQVAKSAKNGYNYRYSYYDENNKRFFINSIDIKKLEKKVKDKGLPWIKIDDYNES